MSDPSKPATSSPPDQQAEPQATNETLHGSEGLEQYEAPKLRRLGTLLELTQSGAGPRTEAFRGSR